MKNLITYIGAILLLLTAVAITTPAAQFNQPIGYAGQNDYITAFDAVGNQKYLPFARTFPTIKAVTTLTNIVSTNTFDVSLTNSVFLTIQTNATVALTNTLFRPFTLVVTNAATTPQTLSWVSPGYYSFTSKAFVTSQTISNAVLYKFTITQEADGNYYLP